MKNTEPLGVGWKIRVTEANHNLTPEMIYTITKVYNSGHCSYKECAGCFDIAESKVTSFCLCYGGDRRIEIVEKTGTKPFKDLSHEINIPGMF